MYRLGTYLKVALAPLKVETGTAGREPIIVVQVLSNSDGVWKPIVNRVIDFLQSAKERGRGGGLEKSADSNQRCDRGRAQSSDAPCVTITQPEEAAILQGYLCRYHECCSSSPYECRQSGSRGRMKASMGDGMSAGRD